MEAVAVSPRPPYVVGGECGCGRGGAVWGLEGAQNHGAEGGAFHAAVREKAQHVGKKQDDPVGGGLDRGEECENVHVGFLFSSLCSTPVGRCVGFFSLFQ